MERDWHYEVLPYRCEFEVPGQPYPDSCGEPAPYRVLFDDGDKMLVCKEHLDFMLEHCE